MGRVSWPWSSSGSCPCFLGLGWSFPSSWIFFPACLFPLILKWWFVLPNSCHFSLGYDLPITISFYCMEFWPNYYYLDVFHYSGISSVSRIILNSNPTILTRSLPWFLTFHLLSSLSFGYMVFRCFVAFSIF